MRILFKKLIALLLTAEARLVLRRYHPRIVAVTGSVGGTSTKDAVDAVRENVYNVEQKLGKRKLT